MLTYFDIYILCLVYQNKVCRSRERNWTTKIELITNWNHQNPCVFQPRSADMVVRLLAQTD